MNLAGRSVDSRERPASPYTRAAWMLACCVALAACGAEESDRPYVAVDTEERPDGIVADAPLGDVVSEDLDREIFRRKLDWALEQGLQDLPIGEIIARIGRSFVGTKYTPGTLEIPGPERLVINLRELDCVTFVENVLALARLVREGGGSFEDFQRELRAIRYRGGVIDGYPSRLHYFSEWIRNNVEMQLVSAVTRELGGEADTEPIDFMGTHREAYPKLAEDDSTLAVIREQERRLSEVPRYFIPEERIAEVAPRIEDGDIIAATSSIAGLDVAHTGFAIWIDGRLHLMHAPLVGEAVQISDKPLAERILDIEGQDGIMVARPL
ncbi:MAG: N-acetylmuramoyl-L-alanine amidase-like domain-containing protein [Longimicrobiales bacterium]